jgi:hypothetical protein
MGATGLVVGRVEAQCWGDATERVGGRAFAQRYSEGVSANGARHRLRLSLRSSWVSE